MPLGAIRNKLRQIRYYSATRPYNRWSRALDISLALALVLAWPTAWMLGRVWVRTSEAQQVTGKLLREPDGRVWAAVAPEAGLLPRGDTLFHGTFTVSVRIEDVGWPFVSSSRHPLGPMTIDLFQSQQTVTEQTVPPDSPALAAIREVLAEHAGLADTTRPAALVANALVLSVVLPIAAWVAVSVLRLLWMIVEAARLARRRQRRGGARCPDCGYDLRASTLSDRCPECGKLLG